MDFALLKRKRRGRPLDDCRLPRRYIDHDRVPSEVPVEHPGAGNSYLISPRRQRKRGFTPWASVDRPVDFNVHLHKFKHEGEGPVLLTEPSVRPDEGAGEVQTRKRM